jgi:hypothetical protein
MSGKPTVATVPPDLPRATEQNDRKFHKQHCNHNPENQLWPLGIGRASTPLMFLFVCQDRFAHRCIRLRWFARVLIYKFISHQ